MIYTAIIATTAGALAALWTQGPFWRGLIIGAVIAALWI